MPTVESACRREGTLPMRFTTGWFGEPSWVVPLIVLLHLCVAVPLAFVLNIWIDEAYSLHTTGKGLGYAFDQALRFETQPPVYFLVLWGWRCLSDSIFFARLLSIVFSAAAIVAAARASRKYFPNVHPGWLSAAVAFHPLTLYGAVEIRRYAMVLFLSALLVGIFHDAFLQDGGKRRKYGLYGFISLVGLYTQYYIGFFLVAGAAALLVLRRWRELGRYLGVMTGVGVCFLPMLVQVSEQMSQQMPAEEARYSIVDCLKFAVLRVLDYAIPAGLLRESEGLQREIVTLVVVAAVLVVMVRRYRDPISKEVVAVLTMTAVLTAVFAFLFSRFGLDLLKYWHTTVLLVPTLLASFAVVMAAGKRRALAVWVVALLLGDVYNGYLTYRSLAKPGDFSRVAEFIQENERPDEPILFFVSETAEPFSHYYTGINSLVPLPRAEEFDTYDVREFALENEEDIRLALQNLQGRSFWLFSDSRDPCTLCNIPLNCDILERFVATNCDVEIDRPFYLARVRYLRLKDPG